MCFGLVPSYSAAFYSGKSSRRRSCTLWHVSGFHVFTWPPCAFAYVRLTSNYPRFSPKGVQRFSRNPLYPASSQDIPSMPSPRGSNDPQPPHPGPHLYCLAPPQNLARVRARPPSTLLQNLVSNCRPQCPSAAAASQAYRFCDPAEGRMSVQFFGAHSKTMEVSRTPPDWCQPYRMNKHSACIC